MAVERTRAGKSTWSWANLPSAYALGSGEGVLRPPSNPRSPAPLPERRTDGGAAPAAPRSILAGRGYARGSAAGIERSGGNHGDHGRGLRHPLLSGALPGLDLGERSVSRCRGCALI